AAPASPPPLAFGIAHASAPVVAKRSAVRQVIMAPEARPNRDGFPSLLRCFRTTPKRRGFGGRAKVQLCGGGFGSSGEESGDHRLRERGCTAEWAPPAATARSPIRPRTSRTAHQGS